MDYGVVLLLEKKDNTKVSNMAYIRLYDYLIPGG